MKQMTARDCHKLSLARIGQVHELKKRKAVLGVNTI